MMGTFAPAGATVHTAVACLEVSKSSTVQSQPFFPSPVRNHVRPQSISRHLPHKRRILVQAAADVTPGPDGGGQPGGDKKVQDMLVDMVRIQSDRMRVTDFVDEKSRQLSSIADEAKTEYDRITADAMKGMDEAGSKVLNKVNADADAFEEELARARKEQETRDQAFDEFEKKVEDERNQGLFFKSLYRSTKKAAVSRADALEHAMTEREKLSATTKKAAGAKGRRILYTFLAVTATLTLVEVGTRDPIEWTKLVVYGGIVLALLAQLSYEKILSLKEDERK